MRPVRPLDSPAGAPSPLEGDLRAGWACEDLAEFGAYRSNPLRSLRRLASAVLTDLGEIGVQRAEFRTHRLQRWSYKALLQFLAWRGLRLFAALVFLFVLIDLTHYFI